MSGIGFSELLLLAVVALLVVGPKRLPEIARTAGELSRTARNAWQSLKSEFQSELDREHNRRIMASESETEKASGPEALPDRQDQEPDDDRPERS